MSNPEIRFLFLLTGFPTIAASKTFTDYDRAVAQQIVAHLGWLPDDEDREVDVANEMAEFRQEQRERYDFLHEG